MAWTSGGQGAGEGSDSKCNQFCYWAEKKNYTL